MSTYIVGDIQGCFAELQALLNQVKFDANQDHLYLAGDLVARGQDSLSVLRFIKGLGDHAHCVLGNHDLHLLAVAAGFKKPKRQDNTLAILEAADKDELLHWLRHQPLLIHHSAPNPTSCGFVLTHAGISPAWNLATAKTCAQEIETILQSDDYLWLLQNMYADQPCLWSPDLQGIERYRYTINAFTRLRFCDEQGRLDMQCKLPPSEVKGLVPWFKVKARQPIAEKVIFGHWAALGHYSDSHVLGLDSGCVWGNHLTLLRWEDNRIFTQKAL